MNTWVNSIQPVPISVVGIIGSLRRASVNRIVFEAATELAEAGMSLTEAPLGDVPFYNGDIEEQGDPASVLALKGAVREADGVIFFTPEYNGSLPAVVKNVLDWLSRSSGGLAIAGKPVGVVATTPGRHGASSVRDQMVTAVAAVKAEHFASSLGVSSINHITDAGALVDPKAREDLRAWLAEFHGFVASQDANRPG